MTSPYLTVSCILAIGHVYDISIPACIPATGHVHDISRCGTYLSFIDSS